MLTADRTLAFLLAALAFSPTTAFSQGAAPPTRASVERTVDTYFAADVARRHFSGSVLIARGDSVLLRKAYGYANAEYQVPSAVNTRYLIASLTKTFTAASILMLRDQGRLRLDDKLSKLIPTFPRGDRIAIEHLLAHAAGVANPDYDALGARALTHDELITAIAERPPLFEPGSKSSYSNAGYNVLAAVVARLTGKDYAAALRELILDPLRLTSTGQSVESAVVPQLATAYLPGPPPTHLRLAPIATTPLNVGSGSLYSNVDDLYAWMRAVRAKRLFDVGSTQYPYGWGRRSRFGGTVLEQTGALNGWSSAAAVHLDSAIYVVALANINHPGFGQWPTDLMAIALGQSVTAPVAPSPVPAVPSTFARYEGLYSGRDFPARVLSLGGSLYFELDGGPTLAYLEPIGDRRFAVTGLGGVITFVGDSTRSTELQWRFGTGEPLVLKAVAR
jgi:CubicO group peptidase (beta-lactamase class C family)